MDGTPQRAKLIKLFASMLYISTFTFGGGFVIVTFMKRKFVDELHWLSDDEMLDMTALAQSAPGAIAVNAAILVGRKIGGAAGIAAAALGTIIPPVVIISIISLFYQAFAANPWVAAALSGMQAGVAAVICDVVVRLGSNVVKEKDPVALALMLGAFVATFVFRVNVVLIILCAALVGAARLIIGRRKRA